MMIKIEIMSSSLVGRADEDDFLEEFACVSTVDVFVETADLHVDVLGLVVDD